MNSRPEVQLSTNFLIHHVMSFGADLARERVECSTQVQFSRRDRPQDLGDGLVQHVVAKTMASRKPAAGRKEGTARRRATPPREKMIAIGRGQASKGVFDAHVPTAASTGYHSKSNGGSMRNLLSFGGTSHTELVVRSRNRRMAKQNKETYDMIRLSRFRAPPKKQQPRRQRQWR